MASTSTSQVLTKRSSDSMLMPPPPPPKRIKRPAKVIDEDSYTNGLSHIIARDFFPGLVETESKRDYLDALESQDPEWIASAERKLTEILTPGPDGRRHRGRRGTSMVSSGLSGLNGETPKGWQGDTPGSILSIIASTATSSDPSEIDTNLSLGAFQAKYTSEDNESFYKLLDKQNLKKSERYAWMWSGNKIASPRQIAHRKREAKLLNSKSSQEAIDGRALLQIEPPDTRPAKPDAWPSRPSNPLMFGPNSFEDATQSIQKNADLTSRAPPKAVVYDNTRLANTAPGPIDPPCSPSLSAVQDALLGRPRRTASEASFPISSPPSTPRVNGYSFVDPDPDPTPPSEPEKKAVSILPSSLLGVGDATPNPFSIKDGSRREALHHRMVDKVARGKRARKREAEIKTPVTPRFASSPRIARGGLTPAAQHLLGKVGGKVGGWEPKPSSLRVGVTPSKVG